MQSFIIDGLECFCTLASNGVITTYSFFSCSILFTVSTFLNDNEYITCFYIENRVCVIGYNSGRIRLWTFGDYKSNSKLNAVEISSHQIDSSSIICIDYFDNYILVGCLCGLFKVYEFNSTSFQSNIYIPLSTSTIEEDISPRTILPSPYKSSLEFEMGDGAIETLPTPIEHPILLAAPLSKIDISLNDFNCPFNDENIDDKGSYLSQCGFMRNRQRVNNILNSIDNFNIDGSDLSQPILNSTKIVDRKIEVVKHLKFDPTKDVYHNTTIDSSIRYKSEEYKYDYSRLLPIQEVDSKFDSPTLINKKILPKKSIKNRSLKPELSDFHSLMFTPNLDLNLTRVKNYAKKLVALDESKVFDHVFKIK